MIHATVTIRIAYDEASGTPTEVHDVLNDAVNAMVNRGGLTEGSALVVDNWEHEIEVEP